MLTPSLLARADQDEQLDDLARVVTNTRHIALAVNDELDLHARLLVRVRVVSLGKSCRRHPLTGARLPSSTPGQDDIEDDVENTTGRLHIATRKIKTLMKRSRDCKLLLCLMATIIILIAVLVLTVKLAPLG